MIFKFVLWNFQGSMEGTNYITYEACLDDEGGDVCFAFGSQHKSQHEIACVDVEVQEIVETQN